VKEELEALSEINAALERLPDGATRERVLRYAWAKHVPTVAPPAAAEGSDAAKGKKPAAKATSMKKVPGKGKVKRSAPTFVKDLNLSPKGSPRFKDFASEKAAGTAAEQCVVAVFYLTEILKMNPIGVDHVFTCFKDMNWRLPSNLANRLSVVSSTKGWLNTEDLSNITLTPGGHNLVTHDLPPKAKKR
jgi:hypothetical protein